MTPPTCNNESGTCPRQAIKPAANGLGRENACAEEGLSAMNGCSAESRPDGDGFLAEGGFPAKDGCSAGNRLGGDDFPAKDDRSAEKGLPAKGGLPARNSIAVFAGTAEGREFCHALAQAGKRAVAFVATEYGSELMESGDNIEVRTGRLDQEAMEAVLAEFEVVVDATHPYAVEVSRNIVQAAKQIGCEYVRIVRSGISLNGDESAGANTGMGAISTAADSTGTHPSAAGNGTGAHPAADACRAEVHHAANPHGADSHHTADPHGAGAFHQIESHDGGVQGAEGEPLTFASAAEVARFLEGVRGTVLLTTGSKDLPAYATIADRIWPRFLPDAAAIDRALELGFKRSQMICMQGPFSLEMNVAMLKASKASWMVTKDSGKPGGFAEKVEAARLAGARILLIRRPEADETGLTLDEAIARFS